MSPYIDEFQRQALKTAQKNSPDQLLAECAWGIASETGEVATVILEGGSRPRLLDELGDVMWYGAVACEAIGLDVSVVVGAMTWEALAQDVRRLFELNRSPNGHANEFGVQGLKDALLQLVAAQGHITNHMKKVMFHRHDLDLELMSGGLSAVFHAVATIAMLATISLEQIVNANHEKLLQKRYPNGYSHQASRDRTV